MTVINDFLAEKGIYMLTMILFFLGVYGIATCSNYMKKLICMNIMQVSSFCVWGRKPGVPFRSLSAM